MCYYGGLSDCMSSLRILEEMEFFYSVIPLGGYRAPYPRIEIGFRTVSILFEEQFIGQLYKTFIFTIETENVIFISRICIIVLSTFFVMFFCSAHLTCRPKDSIVLLDLIFGFYFPNKVIAVQVTT